jgi:hypothetical protein
LKIKRSASNRKRLGKLGWTNTLSKSTCTGASLDPVFQTLCSTPTAYATLNQALKRLGNNQHELLRVLDKPYLSLHNNLSERDITDYVKKRKISDSTRWDERRRCQDTFASLKKNLLKHGILSWHYLQDRLQGEN